MRKTVEEERSNANCTFEMEGHRGEAHSVVSQIEEEEIDHGIGEGDEDDNMSEMSDIPSQW